MDRQTNELEVADEQTKTKEQLVRELDAMRRRVATLEAATTQNGGRFYKYFHQDLIGMAAVTLDGKWLDLNDRLCEILGYPREELVRKTWIELTHPDDLTQATDHFRRLASGDVDHYTLDRRYVRKDGRSVHTTIAVQAFHGDNGGIDCIIGLVEDISARKLAEEALRKSEERFRSYFVQGLIGMAVAAPDQRWLDVNERLCEILGYCRDELLKMRWTEATHPDDREADLLRRDQMIAGEADHCTYEKRFIRKDGRVVYAIVFVRYFRNKDGSVDHTLALIEDITERKQAEWALEKEHRTLKRLLQASDHERQLIAYEIHDGLAQQLAAAIMQFQTYEHQKDATPKQAANAFHAAMTMLSQGHGEARRLISGVRPPILDESGVVTAIAHLVNEKRRAKGPRIEFHSEVDFDRLAPIIENTIYRIVQEGLTNACRHSDSKRVRVELMQHNACLRVNIQDWGIGFNAETFDESRFGLEGIRERTRLLGGTSTIESAPGQGTCLRIELPLVLNE